MVVSAAHMRKVARNPWTVITSPSGDVHLGATSQPYNEQASTLRGAFLFLSIKKKKEKIFNSLPGFQVGHGFATRAALAAKRVRNGVS
uniref:Uncharacterized protein n=1 Tax=Dechloromonas aromatica (strain RCB) TaxID=159087 RepID=Q47D63_DECAR